MLTLYDTTTLYYCWGGGGGGVGVDKHSLMTALDPVKRNKLEMSTQPPTPLKKKKGEARPFGKNHLQQVIFAISIAYDPNMHTHTSLPANLNSYASSLLCAQK